jgi:hypothetical protein
VGGEEAFCSREWTAPPVNGDFGALDRKALGEANLTVTYAEGPSLVADHGFTSGQMAAAIGSTNRPRALTCSLVDVLGATLPGPPSLLTHPIAAAIEDPIRKPIRRHIRPRWRVGRYPYPQAGEIPQKCPVNGGFFCGFGVTHAFG